MKGSLITIVLLFFVALSNACVSRKVQFVCGINETSQIGINHLQPLVDALEKYKVDNGRYPSDWRTLVPKYIDKIPVILGAEVSPDIGNSPIYKVLRHEKLSSKLTHQDAQGQEFKLGFFTQDDRICLVGRNNICEYTSETKEWNCYQ